MSSYHILNSTGASGDYSTEIEYHIPVPVEANPFTSEANYLQARLSGDSEYTKASKDPNIDSAEQVNINQGEILILHENINLNGDRPDHLSKLQELANARYILLQDEAIQNLRDKYRYTSLVVDVVV